MEKALLVLGLSGWIVLGLAHTLIVMVGPRGWRPDRSAPGAAAVVGIPGNTDPRTVGAVHDLVGDPGSTEAGRLALILPAATDSADLLYTRYQLAHLLYPVRVHVERAANGRAANGRAMAGATVGCGEDSVLVILGPGVDEPAGCTVRAESDGHRLIDCDEECAGWK